MIYLNNARELEELMSTGNVDWANTQIHPGVRVMHGWFCNYRDEDKNTSVDEILSPSSNFDIRHWDFSKVIQIRDSFSNLATFNHPVQQWDFSKVTWLSGFLNNCNQFNQPVGLLNLRGVRRLTDFLYNCESFNNTVDGLDLRNARSLSRVLSELPVFNQSVEGIRLGSTKDILKFLCANPVFNQPIEKLDFGSLLELKGFLCDSPKFNQPIEGLNITRVHTVSYVLFTTPQENIDNPADQLWNYDYGMLNALKEWWHNRPAFNHPVKGLKLGKHVEIDNTCFTDFEVKGALLEILENDA